MGTKYIWHGYVRSMIRVYPERKREYELMISTIYGPSFDGTPKGHRIRDPSGELLGKMEDLAFYKEYTAVHDALSICSEINPEFMTFVQLYYWDRRKRSLEYVGQRVHYSPETVRRWNKKLIYTVAHCRGLLD